MLCKSNNFVHLTHSTIAHLCRKCLTFMLNADKRNKKTEKKEKKYRGELRNRKQNSVDRQQSQLTCATIDKFCWNVSIARERNFSGDSWKILFSGATAISFTSAPQLKRIELTGSLADSIPRRFLCSTDLRETLRPNCFRTPRPSTANLCNEACVD